MTIDDLNQYIRQGEPTAAESASAWKTAIGLQAVDGLRTSDYLLETARRNIEGEITIDEVRQLLNSYYSAIDKRNQPDEDTEEADKVAANIKKILSTRTLAFNTNGLISVHRRIFEGVFKHAGELRKYDISKKEWVLRGASVSYLNWEDIRAAIDYDIAEERKFSYKGLTDAERVSHIALFVSGLWQIHPFAEGNTRTTAVFTIQYLRSIGYEVDNELFADNSWYFRNALVRANYKNPSSGINYDLTFLELFFRNLMMGENNEMRNRSMLINPPEGWSTDDNHNTTDDKPVSTDDKPTINGKKPTETDDKHGETDDKEAMIISLLTSKRECSTAEIAEHLGLKPTQTKVYIYRLLADGKIVALGANRNRRYTLANNVEK